MLTIGLNEILAAVYFIVPAYMANAMPIVFGGGVPIDLGRTFSDGERLFGANKTVRGFVSGLLFGFGVGLVPSVFLKSYSVATGFLIALGSLCGDLCGAFVKRRLRLKPGFPLPLLDQLDFIFGALLFSYPALGFSIDVVFLILLVTPPMHLATNVVAYLLKIKENYW